MHCSLSHVNEIVMETVKPGGRTRTLLSRRDGGARPSCLVWEGCDLFHHRAQPESRCVTSEARLQRPSAFHLDPWCALSRSLELSCRWPDYSEITMLDRPCVNRGSRQWKPLSPASYPAPRCQMCAESHPGLSKAAHLSPGAF